MSDEARSEQGTSEQALTDEPAAEPGTEPTGTFASDSASADDVAGEFVGEAAGETTGHPVVDELLGRLEDVDDIPVEERLPIFEAAHEALRDALSGAADQPA